MNMLSDANGGGEMGGGGAPVAQETEEECPLFMTTLPSKCMFRENPALQAVCELAGDTGENNCSDGGASDDGEAETAAENDGAEHDARCSSDAHKPVATQCQRSRERLGVGKRHRRRARLRAHPYTRPRQQQPAGSGCGSQREQRAKARASRYSVGEAQVYMSFLGMPPT